MQQVDRWELWDGSGWRRGFVHEDDEECQGGELGSVDEGKE